MTPPPDARGSSRIEPSELLVVSWNCGGFARTHDLIKAHYGSLAAYLKRMGAAIFCVQETKMGRKTLQNTKEAAASGAVIDGYQSFWSFNDSKGKPSGLNGVATWVRDDVAAVSGVRASHRVLEDPLDQEGRCLLMDLGGLAVLNVYAPHVDSSSDEQHAEATKSKKQRFLQLLWQQVGRLRDAGKSVVLCGDLNLTLRPADCSFGRCWVEIRGGAVAGRPRWPVDAADGTWMRAADAAKALQLACEAPASEMQAQLSRLSARLEATADFKLGETAVGVGHSLLTVNGVRVRSLQQAEEEMQKHSTLQLTFGASEEDLAEVSQPAHYVAERSCVESLRSALEPQGHLADTFARVHAGAVGRFTCWNQQLNLRYVNCGSRLDYVLCDTVLAKSLVATSAEQLAGASERCAGHTAQAALDAATSSGRWQNAPRREISAGEGGLSLQRDDMKLNDTQFVPPHTGIIYTPPSYSDHVPASALFDRSDFLKGVLSVSEKDTKSCMPWTSQPSLSSFFGRGAKRPLEP